MLETAGKNIVVLGAGKSGVSAAKFLLEKKAAKVTLSDVKPRVKFSEEALALEKDGVVLETDGHNNDTILGADMIVLSPGIPTQGEWYEMAKRHEKFIIGEIEFAYRFCDAKIIAITGTNGKTTTATLIYEILKDQLREKVALAGNIGIPFSDIVSGGKKYDYVVLEISSFQLETIKEFKPFIALILNITEDHLDRYSSMQEYAEAKTNIFKNQNDDQYLLLNAEDRFTDIMSPMSKSHKVYFSAFRDLDDGYYMQGNKFVKKIYGEKKEILNTEGLFLSGMHNYENIMASLMVSDILELDAKKTETTIRNFKGLPHRMEFVAEFGGKKYFNDSKATNVDAAVKAVKSFENGVVLILGGREKGTDFSKLHDAIEQNVRAIIALGENKEKIIEKFKDITTVIQAENMEDAVTKGAGVQGAGTVLLSPACASFDLFKNYNHRGDEFKKYVLKAEKDA